MMATTRKTTPATTPMMIRIALARMGEVRDVEVDVDAEEDLDVDAEVEEVREAREDVGATVTSGMSVGGECERISRHGRVKTYSGGRALVKPSHSIGCCSRLGQSMPMQGH
jgi:hypothetical protein